LTAPPTDRFPICAAVRKSDRDLKAAIDQALDELAESGKLAAVFRPAGTFPMGRRPEVRGEKGHLSSLLREIKGSGVIPLGSGSGAD